MRMRWNKEIYRIN